MATIFIKSLKADCIIGTKQRERAKSQPIYFDFELDVDIAKAAASDNLHDALDYEALSECVIDYVQTTKFQLIETLAEKVADLIMQKFNPEKLKLQLTKPRALTDADAVGVRIIRD